MSSSFVLNFAFVVFFYYFSESAYTVISTPSSFNVTVSKDGNGDHKTITEAIKAAPRGGGGNARYIIYIREGVYNEHVEVPKDCPNLTLIGESSSKTKIVDNRSHVGGFSTILSATLDVQGDNFVAMDLSIINSAGPSAGQAVAVKNDSEKSIFYRCSLEGYQDTLYIRKKEQFYRDCNVSGTIDFIFGTGSAVLQNCNIYGRKPDGNTITITADGRSDPSTDGGIVLHSCNIMATPELKAAVNGTVSSYLGRPWRNYSRTVIMQSYMESFISARGWLEWTPGYELTLFYAEYNNSGPGAATNGRVGWPGYRVLKTVEEALPFTVDRFINGSDWLPSSGVPYIHGLL